MGFTARMTTNQLIKVEGNVNEAAREQGGYTVWMQTPEGEQQLGSPSGYVHNKYDHACIWAGWSKTTTENPVIVRDMCGTIAFRANE
jgi:hypothetical protein